jgi:murein DD-endopeptidase MepM/ murein hydrolase activator NlpD
MISQFLKNPPLGKPWLLYGFLGASLVLNLTLALRSSDGGAPEPDGGAELAVAPTAAPAAPAVDANAAIPPELVPPLPEPLGVNRRAGTALFSAPVNSSLSATFTAAPARSTAALSAVYARLFVWDVELRRDLHKGDLVQVLFEDTEGVEPLILAARLTLLPGQAGERVIDAFRYQAQGDRFPSYWASNGTELPKRLIDGPLTDYEQISSLLKDRPTHEGVDFKTPIGSDVVAPRAGTVTRVNWNHAANGNCVEVRFSDGTLAKFLHLNEDLVKEGQRVTAGQLLGRSGNTGRSTGPHLHYQLERGGRVVDPIDYHGTLRRTLPPELLTDFNAKVTELSGQLDSAVAVAGI